MHGRQDPDHPHVLRFLAGNLRLNCPGPDVVATELSWGVESARRVAAEFGPFRTILGFDVVYSDAVDVLAATVAELLEQVPEALALIGFCERFADREERFCEQIEERGLRVEEAAWSALLVEPGEEVAAEDREDVPAVLRARLARGTDRPARAAKSFWLKLLLRYLGLHLLVISRA